MIERTIIPGIIPDALPETDSPIDPGIEKEVRILYGAGVETFESCQGGEGHSYPEPTIRFHGDQYEGFRVFAIAMQYDLKARSLRRTYHIVDGELTGPFWEMTFWSK